VHKYVQSEYFVPGTESSVQEMELALFGAPEQLGSEKTELLAEEGADGINRAKENASDELSDESALAVEVDVPSVIEENPAAPDGPVSEDGGIVRVTGETEAAAVNGSSINPETEITSGDTNMPLSAQEERNAAIDASITDSRVFEEIRRMESEVSNNRTRADQLYAEAAVLYERANVLADSASTLSRRKAARVMEDVESLRARADVLSAEADTLLSDSRILEASIENIRGLQETYNAFGRFYYLSVDDHRLLDDDEDKFKYFQARARAMQFMADAEEKELTAIANRTLSEVYQNQAKELIAGETAPGESPSAELMQRVKNLDDIAARLMDEAAKLQKEAEALRLIAVESDDRADELLEKMEPTMVADVMKMELRLLQHAPAVAPEVVILAEEQVNEPELMVGTIDEDLAGDLLAEDRDTADPAQVSIENTIDATVNQVIATTEPSDEHRTPESDTLNEQVVSDIQSEEGDNDTTQDPLEQAMALMPGQAEAIEPTEPLAPEEEVRSTIDQPTDVIATTAGMLMADVFYIKDNPDPNRIIPINEVMPRGVVFKVQVGAFSKRIPNDLFGDLDPVTGVELDNGLVRYSAGMFMTYDNADEAKDLVRSRGYSDAFVVAFINGNRVTINEAKEQLGIDRPELVQRVPLKNALSQETVVDNVIETTEDLRGEGSASPDEGQLQSDLAKFDMSDLDTNYGDAPNAAPAVKVETIKGLFFTVQVGVYSKPVELGRLFNITPLNTELIRNGMIRYTTGRYSDIGKASARKEQTVALGVSDAFVTAYMNGKRIPISEASQLLEKHGSSILANP
jgi:hypothetical protein